MDDNLHETIQTLVDEIGSEYFAGFEVDDEYACWKVNPFLWTLFCAATSQELTFPKKKSPTERECLVYFLEGFAVARLARIMFDKGGSVAH